MSFDADKIMGAAMSPLKDAIAAEAEAANAEMDWLRGEVERLTALLEQQPEPTPEPEPQPDPEPTPEPVPEPDPIVEPIPEPEPAPGPRRMLVGAAVGGNSDPTPLEREAGKSLDVRRTYWQHDEIDRLIRTCRTDIAAGRMPFPTIKFPHRWEQMAAGAGDDWAWTLADQLDDLGTEVWISLHHEPNGDEPDILQWKATQERLAPIFNIGQVNLAVSYTGYPELHQAEFAFERTFPEGVKGLGVDLYQRYGTTDAGLRWTPLDDFYAKVNAFAKSRGVPWMLTETGVTDEAMQASPNACTELFDVARKHECAMLSYFDSDLNSKGSWRLVGDTDVRRAKRAQYVAELRK